VGNYGFKVENVKLLQKYSSGIVRSAKQKIVQHQDVTDSKKSKFLGTTANKKKKKGTYTPHQSWLGLIIISFCFVFCEKSF
jgi:hypothetical protein